RTRRVPEAASLRIGGAWAAQAPNSDRVRPSAGARCEKAARRDLCGGTGATRFPTATGLLALKKCVKSVSCPLRPAGLVVSSLRFRRRSASGVQKWVRRSPEVEPTFSTRSRPHFDVRKGKPSWTALDPGTDRPCSNLFSWLRVSGTAEMPQIDQSVRHQL